MNTKISAIGLEKSAVCSQQRASLRQELCSLTEAQLREIGAWYGNVTATVEDLMATRGCDGASQNRFDNRN